MAGGFPLKKWAANSGRLTGAIPVEDLSLPGVRSWSPHDYHSALGLQWHPEADDFAFTVKLANVGAITRRSVLSQTAQLFDPLGWLAPVVIWAKIFIQTTWLQGLDWDTPLGPPDESRWRDFLRELPGLKCVRVPRWLGCVPSDKIELHGFADASERAYAAAVYLRTKGNTEDGGWRCSLIMAKTKVAPLKQVSLPRLELCAATLLARLVRHIQAELTLGDRPIHLWSDSTVTLAWIRGHPSQWKTFVANRVSEIQTALPDARWHHVAGVDNPADCASRGISPDELLRHPLWWRGPP